jgi:hypothetical protein
MTQNHHVDRQNSSFFGKTTCYYAFFRLRNRFGGSRSRFGHVQSHFRNTRNRLGNVLNRFGHTQSHFGDVGSHFWNARTGFGYIQNHFGDVRNRQGRIGNRFGCFLNCFENVGTGAGYSSDAEEIEASRAQKDLPSHASFLTLYSSLLTPHFSFCCWPRLRASLPARLLPTR